MPELNLTVLLLLSQIILWGDVPAAPLRDAKESRQKSASFDFFFTSKQTHDFRPIFGPLLRRCSVGRSLERLNFCDYSAADDKICFVLFLFQIAAKIAIKKNLAACQFKFLSQFQHLFKSRTFVVVCCLGWISSFPRFPVNQQTKIDIWPTLLDRGDPRMSKLSCGIQTQSYSFFSIMQYLRMRGCVVSVHWWH